MEFEGASVWEWLAPEELVISPKSGAVAVGVFVRRRVIEEEVVDVNLTEGAHGRNIGRSSASVGMPRCSFA
jgi:hypothetical protein